MKKLICVIGMARSGTSATSGCLNQLGVDFGAGLMTPTPYAPKGYFESLHIGSMHRLLFNELGVNPVNNRDGTRSLSKGMTEGWADLPCTTAAVATIHRWWDANGLDDVTMPGFKDPRSCRLLPLWQRFADEREIQLSPVVIRREWREQRQDNDFRRPFRNPERAKQWRAKFEGENAVDELVGPRMWNRRLENARNAMEEWEKVDGSVSLWFKDLFQDDPTKPFAALDLPKGDNVEGVRELLDIDLVHNGF